MFLLQIRNESAEMEVEVLIEEDSKEISIGAKRQNLLNKATGEWVVFFDSDDFISDVYIKEVLGALKNNPNTDHVGYLEQCNINGVTSRSVFSIVHHKWAENTGGYDHIRCANPKSVIRRTKALQAGYKDLRYAEDIDFSERVTPMLESEVFIDKQLYYYRHISTTHNERYGIK